ncbi:hypothetical protein, partial [Streptomyces sp. NPDC001226]
MERELLERLLVGNDEASVAALAALRCGSFHVVWDGTTPAEPLALVYGRRLRHARLRGIETTNLAHAVELLGQHQQPVRLGQISLMHLQYADTSRNLQSVKPLWIPTP